MYIQWFTNNLRDCASRAERRKRVLENNLHLAAFGEQQLPTICADTDPIQKHFACSWCLQVQQRATERGFAATICAANPNNITAARSDRQPAQHEPVATDNRDIVNADGRQGCLT